MLPLVARLLSPIFIYHLLRLRLSYCIIRVLQLAQSSGSLSQDYRPARVAPILRTPNLTRSNAKPLARLAVFRLASFSFHDKAYPFPF